MDISVVVPVYNSEQSLPQLANRLQPVLEKMARHFELILVNDGSCDNSGKVINSLAEDHPWIIAIDLMRNYGQHNALLCGIRRAKHEVIVTMDDDLQHPPEEIPKLINKLNEGLDVVYGVPEEGRHGFWRGVLSQMTKMVLQKSLGAEVARKVSAFRALRTQLREAFTTFNGSMLSIDVLLTWGTTRFGAVNTVHSERTLGRSNYSFKMLLVHAMNMVTGFSTIPLKVAIWLGFGFTFFGAGVLSYVLFRYITEGSVQPGFPFLASIIAIFSGVQLFSLGIIGEYIARIHLRSMEKPAYVQRRSEKPDPPPSSGGRIHP